MPTDQIDDEETFTYKQNFLQNELNKQNFIYTIDKYKAVFSSVHIIALKVLSLLHHPHPRQDDDQTGLKKPKTTTGVTTSSNNNNNTSSRVVPVSLTSSLDEGGASVAAENKPGSATTAAVDGFRIEGKFRFLGKSSYLAKWSSQAEGGYGEALFFYEMPSITTHRHLACYLLLANFRKYWREEEET